ncbi:MAG: helix-turn-helix transcriptional regulator [Tannerella sp.]|nr:helix-turn-helix transcriptional regulator [Tannerella sp.]
MEAKENRITKSAKPNNDESGWEKYRPYIELLSRVNNSCVYVCLLHVKYLFISPNFKNVLGLPFNENMSLDDKGLLVDHCIHTDDLPFLISLQKRAFEYVFQRPYAEQCDYKYIFEFRATGASGEYIRVVCQYQMLETKESEKPLLLLGVMDIAPDQDLKAPVKFRLVNFKTGQIVNIPVIDNPDISLTVREKEVLALVNDGMMSKEISSKLFISVHTVNRHRQNILEKMNVDNLSEAINYARKLGLLA